ncbi:hypothetical protein ACFQPF_07500 [Fictibacillus iocasae]|uniref:Uncharacterized protein n=1 Tax=Fictibacillus iocasae TaxID=2715437 RepID=A0ABW2NP11_9BACL
MGRNYNWKCKVESSSCGNNVGADMLFIDKIGIGTEVEVFLLGGFTIEGTFQGIDRGFILVLEEDGDLNRINPRSIVNIVVD